MRACTICGMHHPGDPPEDHCYKRDVKAAREALDALEAEQRAAMARAKDRAEQKSKTLTAHFTSESKTDEVYLVSCSPWTLSTTPPPNYFNFEICLNVRQATGQPLGAAIDSASPIDIQNQKDLAKLTFCPSVFLEGIRHCTVEVLTAECSFPTINQERGSSTSRDRTSRRPPVRWHDHDPHRHSDSHGVHARHLEAADADGEQSRSHAQRQLHRAAHTLEQWCAREQPVPDPSATREVCRDPEGLRHANGSREARNR
eukprot:3462086-Rhodomonas_salina.1